MKRITIVSGIQLSDNPRVVKEAATLTAAGYHVEVLCSLLKLEDSARNERLANMYGFCVRRLVDVSQRGISRRLSWQWRRLKRRIAISISQFTRQATVHQLGYTSHGMLRYCIRHPADLYSIHLPQAMWVGAELIRRGAKVSTDIEDWYSEDFRKQDLAKAPLQLLRLIEDTVLKGAAFSSTTSHTLSEALAARYCCRSPIVLYNAFRLGERNTIVSSLRFSDRKKPRVGWVSQVIGPDRGLEQLVEATHHLRQPIEIHLTGRLRPGMAESLKSRLHSASEIVFQDQVPHEKLLALMQTYDIGFAGEIANNRNKDLTVSNKMLHYFLSGVPVVCSDTQGQMEIFAQVPDACRVYQQRDPLSLATAIDSLLVSDDVLQRAKRAAWDAGATRFCWETQEPKLLAAVREAIGPPQ
jgi:glycosyltransferase involved in cell wall biosynthesis